MLSHLVVLLGVFLGPAVMPPGGSLAGLCPLFASEHERFGVNVTSLYGKNITDYDSARTNAAWYLDYAAQLAPMEPDGIEYIQTISARGYHPITNTLDVDYVQRFVEANPGTLWVLGNEPDRVDYQDSQTPENYAAFYHEAYAAIKREDPTALVAPAGVVQPTPLRLRYLDAILSAYEAQYGQPMPVDVWTVHNFILPEIEDDWGAEIPPGMQEYASEGKRYQLEDHDRLDIFEQQIVDFRAWMAAHGYRDTPLLVTEYGILMPPILGFDDARVQRFMLSTFDFLRAAADSNTGYPADDNKLVQAWAWYSLNDYVWRMTTGIGYNGNLFDHDTAAITPLGEAFAAYTAKLIDLHVDPAAVSVDVQPSVFLSAGAPFTLTVDVRAVNAGSANAEKVSVTLWKGDPDRGGQVIGSAIFPLLESRCREMYDASIVWAGDGLKPGLHKLVAEVTTDGAEDRDPGNNRATATVVALAPDQPLYTLRFPAVSALPWYAR